MNTNKTFNLILAFVFAFSLLGTTHAPVLAQEPNPSFTALFPWNRIDAYRWPMDAELTVTIDDPDNGTGVDYIETTTVRLENFNPPSDTWASFLVNGFELHPGQFITVTDGHTTKTHEIQYVTVTEVNPEMDTIIGMATPGAEVQIGQMCDENGCAYRGIIADAKGNWLADLTSTGNVGGNQGVFDIRPGSRSDAFIADGDDDRTSYQWEVPIVPAPAFSVVPNDPFSDPRNIIIGWDFEVGTTVNLCIDNPPFDLECDYADSQIVPSEPNGFAGYQFQFSVDPSVFQIVSGQRVQLDNGLHVEEHIVTNMRLLSVNWDTEQVSGIAEPGSKVEVPAAGGGFYVIRRVTANDAGEWITDFAQPGCAPDEQEILDLRLGQVFFIPEQWDENGNSTKFWWQPPNPRFETNLTQNFIHGFGWVPGTSVTITIDDASNGVGIDYSETLPVRTDNPWGSDPWVGFDPPFNMEVGDTVILTDGNLIKKHVATQVKVTSIDVDTDIISGTANPFAKVYVWTDTPDCCADRSVLASSTGEWMVNFSVPGDEDWESQTADLQSGSGGQVAENDDDGDTTNIRWQTPKPTITVYPDDEVIEGNEWPLNATLTVRIGDPDQPDYATTTSLNPPDQNHALPWFWLNLAGDFNIQPGQLVTVSDTKTTKQTIIVPRNITLIDLLTDTIHGKAESNITNVVLWILCGSNDCPVRIKDVNTDGSWSVNFGVPGEQSWEDDIVDIQPETTGGIYQADADGDGTIYLEWRVSNQPPVISTLTASFSPVQLGQSINATVAFSDPDVGDTHTITWDWGDGSTITVPAIVPSVTTSHTYTSPGVYTITVTVTDAAGESDTESFQYVVIYDPNGGFVTGGGWINSPLGAYTPNPLLTGKATFGFVSKYQKGANVPTGNTEFQFHVAGMNFKSTAYDWLVIAGTKAQFKGTGTINGVGEYKFMLTAIDGSPDKFRIKIWDAETGDIIYDNQPGAEDTVDPSTAIQGGSIVIHKVK